MSGKRRNFRITFTAAAVLLAAIAFLLIGVTSNLRGARVDMTSDKLFTMSPAAVRILQELKVPVQVKLYITPADKMPTELRNLERDVTEQMRNFEQVSDGMIQFSVFNPQDDEEMQNNLAAKGIQPFQVQSVDKDEIGVKLVWSAMTIAYKDKPEEVLARILPGNLAALEQDVIGPIHRLTRESAPKVAVFGPRKEVDPQLAMMYLQQGMQPPEPMEQFSRIKDVLDQGHYETVPVDITPASPIPEDADLLIVMGMAQLNERQVWEINRVLRGGMPVVMAVQAHEYGYSPAQGGGWSISGQSLHTGLEPLLAGIGLDLGKDHFLDEALETIDRPREVNLGGLRMQTREPVRLPIQIRVTESQMDQDSALVNRIGTLFYLWGTPVTPVPEKLGEAGLQATVLIESSPASWEEDWNDGPVAGAVFRPSATATRGPRPLAVLVEGEFPDTFAERAVPDWPAAVADTTTTPLDQGPAAVMPEATPGRLLVVGSAKMFDDNIIAASQNALTQRVIRPVSAREKVVWRIVVVLLVPVILATFGILRAGARRREATRYRLSVRRAESR